MESSTSEAQSDQFDPETYIFLKKPSLLKNPIDTQFVMEQIDGVHAGVRLKRVYLMSVDGASNVDFHQKVDGKGPVVVLLKTSKGVTLGAYTEIGFTGSN